ncbi:hypothetical protein AADG42_08825 [Ammonicoccus fulvus]|uniref:YndJ n=1 Tax=Ammonicoccus fulvus TaxID=3138240 RepID=A0ABZ3FQL6_9ACTN
MERPGGVLAAAHRGLDASTRRWWRLVGRRIDLEGEHTWLDAPMASGAVVRDGWLEEAAGRMGAGLEPPTAGAGLLADLADLDGPGFSATGVAREIRDFYAHTADWRMDAWSQWSPLFAPGGALVEGLFGRRVGQLALPVRPLDVSRGIDSNVHVFRSGTGEQVAAAWLRTLRSTGDYLFSGLYRVARLPGIAQPCVHVAFPLEDGNVQVFLRPEAGPDGSFVLTSPPGPFGSVGAYVVARAGGVVSAAKLPLHERFRLYLDPEQVLRTDHDLWLGRARVLQLHYRLVPRE